jgi:hypothetical protein
MDGLYDRTTKSDVMKSTCALALRRRKARGTAKGNSGRDTPQHDARPACPVLRSSASLSCRSAASRTGVPSSSVTRSPGLSPARSAARPGGRLLRAAEPFFGRWLPGALRIRSRVLRRLPGRALGFRRKRGQCQHPGCACRAYSPLSDQARPVNKYAGRLLYSEAPIATFVAVM